MMMMKGRTIHLVRVSAMENSSWKTAADWDSSALEAETEDASS